MMDVQILYVYFDAFGYFKLRILLQVKLERFNIASDFFVHDHHIT